MSTLEYQEVARDSQDGLRDCQNTRYSSVGIIRQDRSCLEEAVRANTVTSNKKQLKVLVAEDTPLIVEQIREALASLDCVSEVRVVATERDATQILETRWPDVVIVDLMLKEGSGFGILKSIKDSVFRPVRIVMTNYALPNYREYAELLGVDYFLDKVKDFESLCEVVTNVHGAQKHLTS